MNIKIRDAALEARFQKQIQGTGATSAEEALLHLFETKEEQDRWLLKLKKPSMQRSGGASISLIEVRVFRKSIWTPIRRS